MNFMFSSPAAKAIKYASTNPGKLISLLDEDPSLANCKDSSDKTLLHIACNSVGNVELVDFLLNKGADVNAVDMSMHTSLYYAVKHNWADIVSRLLDHDASLALNDGTGQTLYHVASSQPDNCVQILEMLASKGVLDINAVESAQSGGRTAFLCALQSGNKNAAMFFIDSGADLHIEDASQRTYKSYRPEKIGLDQYIATKKKSPKGAMFSSQRSFADSSFRQVRSSLRPDEDNGIRNETSQSESIYRSGKQAKSFKFSERLEKRLEPVVATYQDDVPPAHGVSFRKKPPAPLQRNASPRATAPLNSTPSDRECSLSGIGAICMLRW